MTRMEDTPDSMGRLMHTAVMLGCFSFCSRLLGLCRDMGMAWLLGGGAVADMVVVALRLPHVVRRLFGDGSLSMPLTAMLVRQCPHARAVRGTGDGNMADMGALGRLVGAIRPRLFVVLLGLTGVGLACADQLTALLAPGLSADARAETGRLLRICLPYVLAGGMGAMHMAALHSVGRFAGPAMSPAVFNLCFLAFMGLALITDIPSSLLLATGMLCAGLLQWGMLGMLWRRTCPPGSQQSANGGATDWPALAKACLRRLPTGLAASLAPHACLVVAMAFASSLGEGRMAALYFAERLLEFPLGIVGVAVGMAGLPALSQMAAERRFEAFSACVGESMSWSWLFGMVAACGLWSIAPVLVQALLCHGAFDAGAGRETAFVLRAYLPVLAAFALGRVLLAACNALGQLRMAALSGLCAVGVTVLAIVLGLALLPGHWQAAAPPMGVALGLWSQCVLLHVWLRRRILPDSCHTALNRGRAARQTAIALVTGAAAWGMVEYGPCADGFSALALALGSGGLVFLPCLKFLDRETWTSLVGRWGKSQGSD